jgi:hypothetical protein
MLAIPLPLPSAAIETNLHPNPLTPALPQAIHHQPQALLPLPNKIHLARSHKIHPRIPPPTSPGLLSEY